MYETNDWKGLLEAWKEIMIHMRGRGPYQYTDSPCRSHLTQGEK